MKAALGTEHGDFAPNVDGLNVQQVTVFCLLQDGVNVELNLLSLSLTNENQPSLTSGEVHTTRGIVGTRRPGGASWQLFVGHDPAGTWTMQFENTDAVRALFTTNSILDIALVLTIAGFVQDWPM